jgi:anti-sigma regulatory factor (Ser/Thr protein kinase)
VAKTFEIAGNYAEVGKLGVWLREEFAAIVGDELAESMELAVVELANNTVEHGFGSGRPEGRIALSAAGDETGVTVIIQDDAPAFDPFAAAPAIVFEEADYQDVEDLPEGGMGVALILSLASDVAYRWVDGHNEVTLRFRPPDAA